MLFASNAKRKEMPSWPLPPLRKTLLSRSIDCTSHARTLFYVEARL